MIDIIIPAYNANETLDRALRSLAMQSVADLLYVTVMDDCSDDDYTDIIKRHEKSFKQLTHIRLDENSGPGVARQVGMQNTSQPYIGFLDADDMYYDVYSIARLYNGMINNPDCIVMSGDFVEQREDGEFHTHANDMVWCFSKLYRREFLEKHGIGFNNTRCNEDVGFNTKITLEMDPTDIIRAANVTTYLWSFNHQGITKVNKFVYAYSNGITGYVTNKIDAINFTKNKDKAWDHSFAVLVQLYKVYNASCYFRPEYVQHVFDQARRFTDFMYINPIAERDFINGIMKCKAEYDNMPVLPIISIFDFAEKLGVTVTKDDHQIMAYAKRIEITTAIGCPIDCANCPQDELKAKYIGNKMLSLESYKSMLETVPTDYMIVFSGYAEPFINPQCADMILHAHDKGHKVGLYTTMVGMSMKDWERIKHIPFMPLVIHVPTQEGREKIVINDEYIEKLKAIQPHNYSAHGTIPPIIQRNMYNSHIMGPDEIHDRAGLVDNGQRKVEFKGSLFCVTKMEHPVLVPNGDLYVCCQDFGLTTKIGNLIETPFLEIMDGEPLNQYKQKVSNGEDSMCHKCVMARTKE